MKFALGVDLGGTNIVAGCVSRDGEVLAGLYSEPTRPEEGADAVIGRIVALARRSMDDTRRQHPDAEILGAGIGAPGPLDTRTGVVLLTPNLGWSEMPLRDRLGTALAMPAALDNDANCAAVGEGWRGAARGAQSAVVVTVGTGIGGGIILGGRLYHGQSDCAGEVGHTTIDVDGRRCKCGNYGCLEAYASGPAIARRAIEGIESGAETRLAEYVEGVLDRITAQTVYQAAHDGDPLANDVVRDTAKFLGVGVANLVNTLNPEVVVICGGVTSAGDSLFIPLRREVARRAFKPAVRVCRIVPGELTGTAGVYGAARVFLEGWSRVGSRDAGAEGRT